MCVLVYRNVLFIMHRNNSLGHGIRILLNFLMHSRAGAEAMFADLGHFTVPAIQVCESSNSFFLRS